MKLNDVRFTDTRPITSQELRLGELFVEDCYPEVYRVKECSGQFTIAVNTETGDETDFFTGVQAYSPVLYRVTEDVR